MPESPRYSFQRAQATARSPVEKLDPGRNISIETICANHGIHHIGPIKIDTGGGHRDHFTESEWRSKSDSIAMEVRPQFADTSEIAKALINFGFQYKLTRPMGAPDEWGARVSIEEGQFPPCLANRSAGGASERSRPHPNA
jgi:hypothetical protein